MRLLLAVLMVLVLAACGSEGDDGAAVTGVSTSDDDGYHGIFLDQPYAVPDVALTDTDGRPFDLATQPRRTLVFFGYTNCPDICQVVMSTIASAMARLSDAQRDRLQVAFVTTDPARDTGKALRTYLDRFDPGFIGVTGPLDKIDALGKPLGIYIKKGQKLPSGGYEVDHSTHVYGVVGDQARVAWQQGTSPAQLAADIIRLLKS